MTSAPSARSSPKENGTTYAVCSVVLCVLAPVATLGIILPDEYLSLDGEGEGLFAVFLLSPCLVLALFARCHRDRRRQSVALLILTVLILAFGVLLLAAGANGYRVALLDSPRGPDYMRHRYQRMELFVVPVLQWLACIVTGFVLAADSWRRRAQIHDQ